MEGRCHCDLVRETFGRFKTVIKVGNGAVAIVRQLMGKMVFLIEF